MDAWLDWIGFLGIALVAGWFFFRKQMAENELTEREEDARKNAPLFSSGEGLGGQEGDDGDDDGGGDAVQLAQQNAPAGFGGSLRGPTRKFS